MPSPDGANAVIPRREGRAGATLWQLVTFGWCEDLIRSANRGPLPPEAAGHLILERDKAHHLARAFDEEYERMRQVSQAVHAMWARHARDPCRGGTSRSFDWLLGSWPGFLGSSQLTISCNSPPTWGPLMTPSAATLCRAVRTRPKSSALPALPPPLMTPPATTLLY